MSASPGVRGLRPVVWAFVAVLAAAAPLRADDGEDFPKLGGPGGAGKAPTVEELEALAASGADGSEAALAATRTFVQLARVPEGPRSPGFGWKEALLHAAAPARGLALTKGTFEALPQIAAENPKGVPGHVERCRAVSMLLERRTTQSDPVRVAAAYGRLSHAYGLILVGRDADSARAVAAAKVVEELDPDALKSPAWEGYVRAMLLAGIGAPPLGVWADEQVTRLVAAGGSYKTLQTLAGLARVLRLAEYEDKGAAAELAKVLPPLGSEGAIPESETQLIGLYNRGVTAARRLKVPLKVSYRTKPQRTRSGLVRFELPLHTGWVYLGGGGDQDDGGWVRDFGVRDKTTLQVWKYSTSTDYVDDEGKVIGGDNVGGRLKKYFESDKASLKKVKKANAAVGKISKGIPSTRGYEIRGEDEVGLEKWFREWYFKSEVQRVVLNLSLRREGIVLQPDPEIEFIIDSMSEPEPTGK